MTDQIASITLRADVSDLKTASNELDRLGEAAAGAVDKADNLNSVFRAGAESAKQGSEGIKEQQNALKGLLENIDPVTKALNRLDEQQESLRKFQAKGFLDTETFQAYNKIAGRHPSQADRHRRSRGSRSGRISRYPGGREAVRSVKEPAGFHRPDNPCVQLTG